MRVFFQLVHLRPFTTVITTGRLSPYFKYVWYVFLKLV